MYTENAPTYDAVQWDGTPAAQAEIETRLSETMDPSDHQGTDIEDGVLVVRFQYAWCEIPVDGWLVSAPGWGPGPRRSNIGVGQVLTDAQFAARFSEL